MWVLFCSDEERQEGSKSGKLSRRHLWMAPKVGPFLIQKLVKLSIDDADRDVELDTVSDFYVSDFDFNFSKLCTCICYVLQLSIQHGSYISVTQCNEIT